MEGVDSAEIYLINLDEKNKNHRGGAESAEGKNRKHSIKKEFSAFPSLFVVFVSLWLIISPTNPRF